MAVRIDGKAVAAKVRGEIAEEVAALKKQGVQTGMAVVLVGEDSASKIYVRNKGKACAETGIYSLRNTSCRKTPRRRSFWRLSKS